MAYFDDLSFLDAGVESECASVHDMRSPPYALLFARTGHVYLRVDHGPPKTFEGPLALWHNPGHAYEYSPEEDSHWHRYWVTFDGPRARRIVEQGLSPLSGMGHVLVRRSEVFAESFEKLVDLVLARDVRRHPEAVLALETLIVLLWKDWYGEERARRQAEIEQVADDAARDPYAPFDFREAADRIQVSYRHFCRLFREYMGSSPHEYLLLCRMRRAARDLLSGELPVKAVALRAGYEDPAQFSKVFKKKMGMPPQGFRRYRPGA